MNINKQNHLKHFQSRKRKIFFKTKGNLCFVFRINESVRDKLFQIESPRLIPTRSISSSGLTVIDYQNSPGRKSHRSFEHTPGITNDALLVMH